MIRARMLAVTLAPLATTAAAPARADLNICNRTSYRMQVALAIEHGAVVSTRGKARSGRMQESGRRRGRGGRGLPTCAYAAGVWRRSLPEHGEGEFCVRETDFSFVNARGCPLAQQARFSAAKPSDSPNGPVVNLAEEADYGDAQALLAGIQRLLSLASYDATPIDGVDGAKTKAAIARFVRDRKLNADAAERPEFFDALIAAAQRPEGLGFSWCNETTYTVMASLGLVEMGSIVTRGWYRVPPGQCLRPDLSGEPLRFYSYAEAMDADGRTVQRGGAAMAWGGKTVLCTREGRFEVTAQKDCAAHGLNSAGFAVIDMGEHPSAVVTFR
jgi:uncharacterized membrane protein